MILATRPTCIFILSEIRKNIIEEDFMVSTPVDAVLFSIQWDANSGRYICMHLFRKKILFIQIIVLSHKDRNRLSENRT